MNVETIKPNPYRLVQAEGRKVLAVPVARIESCRLREDGRTWLARCWLMDGRLVCVNLCPGEAISVCEIEYE